MPSSRRQARDWTAAARAAHKPALPRRRHADRYSRRATTAAQRPPRYRGSDPVPGAPRPGRVSGMPTARPRRRGARRPSPAAAASTPPLRRLISPARRPGRAVFVGGIAIHAVDVTGGAVLRRVLEQYGRAGDAEVRDGTFLGGAVPGEPGLVQVFTDCGNRH